MYTLTKTKTRTATGIALIGLVAVAAGIGIFQVAKKYNPVPNPVRVTSGNIAGSNIKDADLRCSLLAKDYSQAKYFFNNNEFKLTNEGLPYPKNDYACFSNNAGGDLYIGGASSTDPDVRYSPDNIVGAPAGYSPRQSNSNAPNNYCCDIKKYYSPEEVNNCKVLTEDNFGRLRDRNAQGQLAKQLIGGYQTPLSCAQQGKKFICYSWYTSQRQEGWCASSYEECKKNGDANNLYACPIGGQACSFWAQTNNRGRAGLDLCKGNGYSGTCVNPYSGEYIGCKKPGEDKCVYIDIYNNPREKTVNLPSSAIVCSTGYNLTHAITDAKVVEIGCDYVIIEWTTDNPGFTEVDYGVVGANDSISPYINTAWVTKHRAKINNLKKNTKYWFNVVTNTDKPIAGTQLTSKKLEFTTSCKAELSCADLAKTIPYKTALNKCNGWGASESSDGAKPNAICVNKFTGEIVSGGEFGNGSAGCISPWSGSYFCIKQNDQGVATDPNNKVCYYDRFTGKTLSEPTQ